MNQAVILAGGKATRMRPYTDDRPKAMVEIGGIPIIDHQIRWLTRNGIRDIVISCGYKAEVIQDRLGEGKALGVKITYAVEADPLGRGGGLKFAAGYLPEKGARWFALNGDVLCDFPIAEMVVLHEANKATATIALAQYRSTWGIADLDGDLIMGFTQSPLLPYWVNGGVYCFEPKLAALLPEKGDHEDSTFPELAAEGRLAGYRIDGYWRGIDNAKDIIEATEELSERLPEDA